MKALHKLYTSFLVLLAAATDREMAKMLQYLKEENRTLRGKLPKRIELTPKDRQRLVKLGRPLGSKIRELITIASPRTFARWVSGETKSVGKTAKTGRRRTKEQLRELIVSIARELGAGYTRVMGELKKLGIKPPSRNTVKKILKAEGLDPGPNRGKGSWDEFLRRHAETLWACDFLSKKVWTKAGLIDFFILFFIHVGTRRVFLAGVTTSPNSTWVAQQARNLAMHVGELPVKPTMLIRDCDTKFTAEFDGILESEGIEIKKVGPRAPNMNAIAERWVQSIQQECLDHFVVFGEKHLRHIVSEYVKFHNDERPHQGVGNTRLRVVGAKEPPPECAEGEIVCASRLGGMLKHFCRKAA